MCRSGIPRKIIRKLQIIKGAEGVDSGRFPIRFFRLTNPFRVADLDGEMKTKIPETDVKPKELDPKKPEQQMVSK